MYHQFSENVVKLMSLAALLTGLSCSSDKKEETTTTPTTVSFTDVAPIIKANCSASGCHGKAGASSTIYEENEANFKKDKATIVTRINLEKGANLFMPVGGNALSDADKKKISDYK